MQRMRYSAASLRVHILIMAAMCVRPSRLRVAVATTLAILLVARTFMTSEAVRARVPTDVPSL
jgi:hypothetical protein